MYVLARINGNLGPICGDVVHCQMCGLVLHWLAEKYLACQVYYLSEKLGELGLSMVSLPIASSGSNGMIDSWSSE
jgi:hypothetical protein